MILDVISFVILITIITALLIVVIVQRSKIVKYMSKSSQAEIDNAIIFSALQKTLEENDLNKIEQTDGFVKFLSESRDWAFGYIEEVQAAFKQFDDIVSAQLKYSKTYGSVVDSHLSEQIRQIDLAYEDLKKVFPSEN
jgi:hypothetical protein